MTINEKLKISNRISTVFLSKATIDGTFNRRTKEKIFRAEANTVRKKWDRITLGITASLIIIVCILIILQNQISIFSEDSFMIPLILLITLLIICIVFAIEYYYVGKEGSRNFKEEYPDEGNLKKELMKYQKSDTRIYNLVKKTFDIIHDGDPKFILATLTLKNLFDLQKIENESIKEEKLFRYLMLIITNKKTKFNKLFEADEEGKNYLEIIHDYLKQYKIILADLKEVKLPTYFKEHVTKMKTAIEDFETQAN